MGVLDGLWHLLNFFAPAFFVGAVAAALTKLLWWRELAAVPWLRLSAWAVLASALVLIGGLVVAGRDGRIGTYGVMVLATAASLWWTAFRPRRG